MVTSDEWYAALDNAFCFFVEGQSIGSDAGVDGGSVEEALYHCEESSSLWEAVVEWLGEERHSLGDDVEHRYILINDMIIEV